MILGEAGWERIYHTDSAGKHSFVVDIALDPTH